MLSPNSKPNLAAIGSERNEEGRVGPICQGPGRETQQRTRSSPPLPGAGQRCPQGPSAMGKAAGQVEEILSSWGGVLRGSPASPLLRSEKGFAPARPQEHFPWAQELGGGMQSQGAVLGLPYPEERSAQQEQREGRGAAPSSLPQPARSLPILEAHSPHPPSPDSHSPSRSLEGHPLPRVVGKGTLASKVGSGDPMTS